MGSTGKTAVMHIGFLNPQGNFDAADSYWTDHPDFGGQLVYVKQLALAMAEQGHQVDILTRQIIDPDWPEFAEQFDAYADAPNVRIIRLPAGPKEFLRKELLWSHLARDWVPNILQFYREEGKLPDAMTAHFGDGGICAVLIQAETGIPFTFTGHSLGAWKMDKFHLTPLNLAQKDEYFHFGRRLVAERLSMNHSAVTVTSTKQQERFHQYAHPAYQGAVDVNDDEHFATIPPGVNAARFSPDVRLENEEAIYERIRNFLARDIAEERRHLPAIIAASRLEPKKNHLGLVTAFARRVNLTEKANLVILTKGVDNPLKEKSRDEVSEIEVLAPMRDLIEEKGLAGKISAFPVPNQGALAATYRFFAQSRSVFALVSHHEPFGLAPLEAALAGLPVVATKNGGPQESLRRGDEEYGVLVDPESFRDIANGLERIICNPQVWEDLHTRGHQHVLENYTWKQTAQGYLEQLEKIVANSEAYKGRELLPIHPYFRNPQPENDVTLKELLHTYFGFHS